MNEPSSSFVDDTIRIRKYILLNGCREIAINEMGWSMRASRRFDLLGIRTIGDLISRRKSEIRECDGIGQKTLHEIEETLAIYGLNLEMDL